MRILQLFLTFESWIMFFTYFIEENNSKEIRFEAFVRECHDYFCFCTVCE